MDKRDTRQNVRVIQADKSRYATLLDARILKRAGGACSTKQIQTRAFGSWNFNNRVSRNHTHTPH